MQAGLRLLCPRRLPAVAATRRLGCRISSARSLPRRFASSSSSAEDRGAPKAAAAPQAGTLLPPFLDECLRGVGQVIFLNSPASGALTLAALVYGDPWLGALAAAGTASATATARVAGLDAAAISAGLYGYNGCLVGCAFAVFLGLPAGSPAAAAAAVGGAALTAPLAAALKPLCGGVPQWTWAFNTIALASLAVIRPLAGAPPADPAAALSAVEWVLSPLAGVAQIFVVGDAVSGAMILGATALYSPACAVAAAYGSAVGAGTGYLLGAPAAEIATGLWGFNPSLTALAVSVFYVPSAGAAALATGGAVATAAVFGGAKGAVAASLGIPIATLPFCAVASGCHLLSHANLPGLVLAAAPHSPEKNVAAG